MANTPPHFMANGNIVPSRFVMGDVTAPNKALQAGANDIIMGVSFEGSNYPPLSDLAIVVLAASQGQYFRMYGEGDICLIESGSVLTAFDRVKADAVGRAVPIAAAGTIIQQIGGVVLDDAAAAGELVRIAVAPNRSERPALV